jgi:hypothetical protein
MELGRGRREVWKGGRREEEERVMVVDSREVVK